MGRMPSWAAKILDVPGLGWQQRIEHPPLPDHERILKIEQAAKAYALRIMGVSAWDTWEVEAERAEAADEFPEVAEQIERDFQAHFAHPANWTPGLLPHDHPASYHCRQIFMELFVHLEELASSKPCGGPYYHLAEAFKSITKLTATLPRCGVEDITPLLDMTHELGEWMQNALPRELPPRHR